MRAARRRAHLARPADWERAPFSKLQALPPRAKPISEWESDDQAFREVAAGIRRAILGGGDGSVAAPVPEGTTNAGRRPGAERAAAVSVAVMLLAGWSDC